MAESRSRQIHLERRRVDSFTIRGARRGTAVDNKRKRGGERRRVSKEYFKARTGTVSAKSLPPWRADPAIF